MTTFMKDKNTTTKMMFHVIIALIPIIVFSFYKNGVMPYLKGFANAYEMFYPIIFIVISTLSTLIFETIYQLIFNEDKNIKNIICNSYSYMPGLFLSFMKVVILFSFHLSSSFLYIFSNIYFRWTNICT